MAKGCFDVQKSDFGDMMALSPQFRHTWIKIILLRGKFKFLLELLQNVFKKKPKDFSICVMSIVKSSSRNGLEILQN